jgi:deazaflavin-dependent oxidoreductase (nitroreductase family)
MRTEERIVDSITGNVANHVKAYVDSNGADGHIFRGNPTLLLTTRGRRSGLLRRQALIYGRDGERYVAVASRRGAVMHPAWYLNLLAEPDVQLQVGSERFRATARIAPAADTVRLWEMMVEVYPKFVRYQEKTTRQFPIVIFERASGASRE